MAKKLKKLIFAFERRFPTIGGWLVALLRKLRYWAYRVRYRVRSWQAGSFDPQVEKIIYIDPQSVVYTARTVLTKHRGAVLAGTWDKESTKLFHDTPTYRMLAEHFVSGVPWQKTTVYQEELAKIEAGQPRWGCTNQAEFDAYLARIDDLYADIRDNGYKHNTEPDTVPVYAESEDKNFEHLDEVAVSIGRDGAFLFNDGAHRLAIAQILAIPEIPVVVVARHQRWVDLYMEIAHFAKTQGGRLYQCAFHPDLMDIPYSYGAERWPAITEQVSPESETALDIGGNLGYMSYLLEKEHDLRATVVEVNPHEVRFAKRIRDALGASYEVRQANVFELNAQESVHYDTVLALNIFHHFLKRESEFAKLRTFLQKLRCREMYFETHNPEEKQMEGAYRNFDSKEFVDFVRQETGLETCERLGEFDNGRVLYRLA